MTASNGWGNRVLVTTPPVSIEGHLLSPGFQMGVGTALFGTVGQGGQLDTYLASASGLQKQWSAQLTKGNDKVLWNAQPDGSMTVVWEDGRSGRLMRQLLAHDGSQRGAAQPINSGSVLAWGMPAYGPPTTWVLTAGENGEILAQIPVVGDRTMSNLPPLKDASAWDFHAGAQAVVVGVANGKICSTTLQSPKWRVVHESPKIQALHSISLNGDTTWAEWTERDFGLRRAKVP